MKCFNCQNEIDEGVRFCSFCGAEIDGNENIDIDKIKSSDSKAKKLLHRNLRVWHTKDFDAYKGQCRYLDLERALQIVDSLVEYFGVIKNNIETFEASLDKFSMYELKIANAILNDFKKRIVSHFNKISAAKIFKLINNSILKNFSETILELYVYIVNIQKRLINIDSSLKITNESKKIFQVEELLLDKKNLASYDFHGVNKEHIKYMLLKKIYFLENITISYEGDYIDNNVRIDSMANFYTRFLNTIVCNLDSFISDFKKYDFSDNDLEFALSIIDRIEKEIRVYLGEFEKINGVEKYYSINSSIAKNLFYRIEIAKKMCSGVYISEDFDINNDVIVSFDDKNMKEEKENNLSDKNIEKRIYKWKEKLIDLSKRNRLLNFKSTKTSTLRIIDEQPPEVYRALVQNSQEMEFLHINVDDSSSNEDEKKSVEELNAGIEFKTQEFSGYEVEDLERKYVDKYLQTKRSKNELTKVLTKISSTAKSTNDDLGYNVLFLSLGSVVWYESENSNEKMESPLILVPVEIKRKSINTPYTIKYNEDSVILNPALILKFKRDFGINLEDIAIEEFEIDPIEIFTKVKEKIKDKNRWKLLNNIYIGLFSFAKFVMYKDLDTYQHLIKGCDLVKTICGVSEERRISTENICPLGELEKKIKPQLTFQILDADSSQQQAIQVVKEGHNSVIEGPPGTGKSQTIANIISELLAQNKKVLFVSQKIAALEVVKSRLDKYGLSPYCLELHSNKTNKKRVLDELLEALNNNFSGHYNEGNLSKLSSDIDVLKKYSNELHTPIGALDFKPYDALGIVLKNSAIPDMEYIFSDYDKWTKETFNRNKDLFTSVKDILTKLGNPKNHAMYGTKVRDIEFEEKIQLKNVGKDLISNIDNINKYVCELKDYLLLNGVDKISEIEKLLEISEIVLQIPVSAIDNIAKDDNSIAEDIKTICNIVKQFNLYNNRIKNKYNLGILSEDIEDLITKFTLYKESFISRISLKYYKQCKFIRTYFVQGYRPNIDELINDLKNLNELKQWVEKLEEFDSVATSLYDKVWNKNNPDENEIKNKSEYLIKFKEIVNSGKYFDGDILAKFNTEGIDYIKIDKLIANIKMLEECTRSNYSEFEKIVQLDTKNVFSSRFKNVPLQVVKEKVLAILGVVDDLTLWFRYLEIMDNLNDVNLTAFLDICIEKDIPLTEYDTAFETQFLRAWLNGFVYRQNPSMKKFNSLDHDSLVKEFRYLDKDQIKSAKVRLLNKLSANSIQAKECYYKEATELLRQGKLQRLRKSLRQIIKSIPNLFVSIKPCLMMSPSTVAQLLDPEIFKFDVIIFDEASQLTTEDCIGSIIRGKKMVVAGDTRQLPPTSFFKTVVETDEDIDEEDSENIETSREDLDSILNECTTSGFPQCMLKWHYRSKHEHLIAFSNKHLYQELYTFPNCIENDDTLGIKFIHHTPVGTTKENKCLEEAQIVATAIMEHARNHPELSLGVATLNIKQKGLIESELEKLREQDPSCEDFFSCDKQEYFFVKNIESIQGDERDVIMISIGYFKNQNGVLPMNFGPINQDGGERRLNVLITRARNMVQVFSGIKATDFNMDKTDKQGVQLLQWYLDFAERGEIALHQSTAYAVDDSFASPFEEAVCNALRAKGYSVKTQVGCSGYKIDLAIRDKNDPGRFLLGIECDGASYHSSATARDRDRLRQEVLENLGWKIYRIWSTDWFKNSQKQIDKLVDYIENLSKERIVRL